MSNRRAGSDRGTRDRRETGWDEGQRRKGRAGDKGKGKREKGGKAGSEAADWAGKAGRAGTGDVGEGRGIGDTGEVRQGLMGDGGIRRQADWREEGAQLGSGRGGD